MWNERRLARLSSCLNGWFLSSPLWSKGHKQGVREQPDFFKTQIMLLFHINEIWILNCYIYYPQNNGEDKFAVCIYAFSDLVLRLDIWLKSKSKFHVHSPCFSWYALTVPSILKLLIQNIPVVDYQNARQIHQWWILQVKIMHQGRTAKF